MEDLSGGFYQNGIQRIKVIKKTDFGGYECKVINPKETSHRAVLYPKFLNKLNKIL